MITLLANLHNHILIKKHHFELQKFKTKELAFCFVLINMFIFLGLRLVVMQALIHSYLSFFDFLNYVIHFCKFPWANLMKTYFKPTMALSSIYSCILKSLKESMSKRNPLKTFH